MFSSYLKLASQLVSLLNNIVQRLISSGLKYLTLGKLFFFLSFSLVFNHVYAVGLQVSTIKVEFEQGQQSNSFYLMNSNLSSDISIPLNAQVRVFEWKQGNNEDQLIPTDSILLSPPIAQLAPEQRQLVRIIRRPGVVQLGDQLTYRLIINELPTATPSSGAGVNFITQYSVPMFIYQADRDQVSPNLEVNFDWSPDSLNLSFVNTGNGSAQISRIFLRDASGNDVLLNPGLLGYVLANSQRSWSLPLKGIQKDKQQIVVIEINGQETNYPIDQE